MTTTPDPTHGEPRRSGEDEIITALKEIAGLLRGIAERAPCPENPTRESGGEIISHGNPGQPGERTKAPTDQLTRRERQVLEILITGASNRVISRRLGIAERTVKNNLHAIYRKLGVTGRSEAIVRTLGDHHTATALTDTTIE